MIASEVMGLWQGAVLGHKNDSRVQYRGIARMLFPGCWLDNAENIASGKSCFARNQLNERQLWPRPTCIAPRSMPSPELALRAERQRTACESSRNEGPLSKRDQFFLAATRGTSTRCSWSWTGPRTRPSWGPTQSWASPWQTHGRGPLRGGSLSTSTSQTWQVRGDFHTDHSRKIDV
jgi:hypothetical protein